MSAIFLGPIVAMSEYLLLFLSTVLVNNFVLVKFLGLCPFMGVSKKLEPAVGMGLATAFVLTLTSAFCYLVDHLLLIPLEIEYLRTMAYILVIAVVVQFTEMVVHKTSPDLYRLLGIYLPLITTNCAVLGVAITNVQKEYGILTGIVNGFATALGFTIAIVILAGLREKMEYNEVPESFKGMPMVLLTAGLMAIAFCGFSGLI